MVDNKKISNDKYDGALLEELNYVGNSNTNITSGKLYFKDAVVDELKGISSIPDSINKSFIKILCFIEI